MENKSSQVPQIEALAYKGTPEKPDIKIFVSHRIDLDSETIDNPLYIPIRCGAVYDTRENITMLGDDTGDNISEKRNSFCELTVQYWAWKNIKADYYGFCHYRRYLSFSDEEFEVNDGSYVREKYITKESIRKYSLLESQMRKEIEAYDVIFSTPTTVNQLVGSPKSNYEYYKKRPQLFAETEPVDLLIELVKEKYPEYATDVDLYFSLNSSTFNNCYVMKKEVFDEYNQWLFSTLFEFEKRLDTSGYSLQRLRAPAFMSEPLRGIYFLHQQRTGQLKVAPPHQLVFFERPERIQNLSPAFAVSNVPIVLIFNDFFTPYSAATLQSILTHTTPNHNYDIIIFINDLSEQNRRILQNMALDYSNVSIRFSNIEPLIYQYRNMLYAKPRLTLITFYRLALPYFLQNYERIIYIDCDLIFNADIAKLFEVQLGNNYLAGVRDIFIQDFLGGRYPQFIEYCNSSYPLKNLDEYVNAGVLLYNLSELRRNYSLEEVMRISTRQKYFYEDQDVLNLLCAGHILLIDERWNVGSYGVSSAHQLDFAPYVYSKNYLQARTDPFVVHYAGSKKPWDVPAIDLADYFWHYARVSPLYEVILHRMMKSTRTPPPTPPNPPYRSKARRFADKLLPKSTKRRNLAKKILPKDSRRWNFCKKIYYRIFKR